MRIAVYCGSTPGNRESYLRDARRLGNWIGNNGHSLIYGGSKTGLMGAVADGVLESGGSVTGVLPDVPEILARKHPALTEVIQTDSMASRKREMILRADAYIALPGGIGTLDEVTEVLSLSSLNIISGDIVFFNTDGYYEPIRAVLNNIIENGFGRPEYFEKIQFVREPEEIKLT